MQQLVSHRRKFLVLWLLWYINISCSRWIVCIPVFSINFVEQTFPVHAWCSAYQCVLDTMFPQPCRCSFLCVWSTTVDQQPIDSHNVIFWMDVSLVSWSVINNRHSTSYLVHTKTWWPVGRKSTQIRRISSACSMGARSLRGSAWTFRGRWWQLEGENPRTSWTRFANVGLH